MVAPESLGLMSAQIQVVPPPSQPISLFLGFTKGQRFVPPGIDGGTHLMTSHWCALRFVFRSCQECSIHVCHWHQRMVLPDWGASPSLICTTPWRRSQRRGQNGKHSTAREALDAFQPAKSSNQTWHEWRDRCHCQIAPSSLMWPTTRCSDFVSKSLDKLNKVGQGKGENILTAWQGQWCTLHLETDLGSPWLTRASGCRLQEAGSVPALIITVSLPTFPYRSSQMTHNHFCSEA